MTTPANPLTTLGAALDNYVKLQDALINESETLQGIPVTPEGNLPHQEGEAT